MVIHGTSIYIVIKLIYYGIYMLHTSLQCHHISKYHGIAVLIQHIYIVFTHLPFSWTCFQNLKTHLEEKNYRFTSKPTGLLVLVSGKTLQAKSLPVVFLGLKAKYTQLQIYFHFSIQKTDGSVSIWLATWLWQLHSVLNLLQINLLHSLKYYIFKHC